MKILIASPFAEPEKGACIIRVNSFKELFESKKHSVKVLAPKRNRVGKASGVKRYSGIFWLLRELYLSDFDVVIGTSPPMTHSFFAMLFCMLNGKPFFLDVRDPWTYVLKKQGFSGWKLSLYGFIERFCYRHSRKIFVVTPAIKKILKRQGADKSKIVIVSNGTIPKKIYRDKKEGEKTRKKLGISKNKTVFLFAGSFIGRGIESLAWAISSELKRYGAHLLLVIGAEKSRASELKKLEIKLRQMGLDKNFSIVDSSTMDFRELYKYFSAADFAFNPIPAEMDYAIPAKTYDYIACGLPVLALGPAGSQLEVFLGGHDAGFYFSSEEGLRRWLRGILSRGSKHVDKRKRLLEIANKFDREGESKKVLLEILKVLDNAKTFE